MNRKGLGVACAGLLALGQVGASQAALYDRGGGLIYDDALDITWLQDANYAQTSGYDTDGSMGWDAAKNWAASITAFNHRTWLDPSSVWRLPTVNPVNGVSFNYTWQFDGTSDWGYNISSPGTLYAGSTGSELAYMFYNNLGNSGIFDTSGNPQAGGLANTGPFENLLSEIYWSGTGYAPDESAVWAFKMYKGDQAIPSIGFEFYAWAVRDGDVAPVPLPAAVWLFGSGLLGLGIFKRKSKA